MTTALVWPFASNWEQPITETLSWLTAVITSKSGAEQRQALRQTPRRKVEFTVQLYKQERSYFDLFLNKYQGSAIVVPMVMDSFDARYEFLPGDTHIPAYEFYDPATFTVGGYAVLRQDTFNCVAAVVTSVDANGLTVEPLERALSSPVVSPGMVGWITDTANMTAQGSATYSGTVRFESGQRNPRVSKPTGLFLYGGFPVLHKSPNYVDDLDYTYDRPLYTTDNQTSIPRRRDGRGFSTMTQRHVSLFTSTGDRSAFLDLMYALRGQLTPIWVPTFNNDLAPGTSTWPDPASNLAAVPLRELAIDFLKDGTFNIRQISNGGFTVPSLDTVNGIYKTSFLSLKRLGIDDIEIQHYTRTVSTVSLLFRDAPDLRRPEDYFKNPFAASDAEASAQPESDLRHLAVVTTGVTS